MGIWKHGHNTRINGTTKTYRVWQSLRKRCHNPKNKSYKYYGGRGIKVCESWNKFKNFLTDMGECPDKLTIERINNDKGYSPDNCKWATFTEQSRSSRQAKLNPLKVQVIKKLLRESKLNNREIGKIFGVTSQSISGIKLNKNWADIIYEGLT